MRKLLAALVASVATLAVVGSAQAAVTVGPNSGLGVPSFVQDANGQQAALCFAPGPCGAGAPTEADFADATQDQETFYWHGDVTVSMPEGDLAMFFTVEGTNAPLAFQRAQLDGDKTMPNGTYVITTPFGVFTLNKTAAGSVQRWRDRFLDGSDPAVGPIDNFLTSASAPTGFYGDGATTGPVVGGASVSVQGPGGPTDVGTTSDWTIIGAKAGAPVPTFLANPLDLGAEDVGQAHDEGVTIRNGGTAPLTISNPVVAGAGFVLVSNGCTTLAPGENCTVRVSATASRPGPLTGTLTVTDNTAAGSHTVALRATGNALPVAPVVIDNTRPNTTTTIIQQVPGAGPAAAIAGSARVRQISRTTFEGRVVSVNRTRKTFRLRVQRIGLVTIKATAATRYEHLRGFRSIRVGQRLEATTRRVNGVNVATVIETSGKNR